MAEGERQAPEEQVQKETQEAFALDVPQAILFSIGLLTELAWQKMGLHLNPVTKQVERDFNQARLAIDTVALLVEMVKGHVSEREYDQLRTTLANLRLNFAEQVQKQGS